VPDRSANLKLSCLPRPAQWLLGGFLATAATGYGAVLLLAYVQVTSPNSSRPNFRELDGMFFSQEKPVSPLERLLEATEGPMNRAGTMRPAFTVQSVGWEALTQNMTAEEKVALEAQREGERLALLDWVRSGLSHEAYEADDFRLGHTSQARPITAKYLITHQESPDQGAQKNVRIRSILADRCVTCHGENGRNEHARWIPLDAFEHIERQCRPEAVATLRPTWLIAALVALLPLALLSGPLFYCTNTPLWTRRFITVLPFAALIVTVGCWLLGRPGTYFIHLMLGAAALAAIGVMIQIIASFADLFAEKRA
jgi:hypothetical protein